MRETLTVWILGSGLGALVAGCASPGQQLERAAKDWCLTIRASQVLPVYPLSEDVRPGDVFVVSATAKEQAEIYEEKGFLSLDQQVTRLKDLPYEEYYSDPFEGLPPVVPGDGDASDVNRTPLVAFPSYNFEVTKSGGLKIALPIQGVASGLGLMGASKAIGSVTIRDAYTYGVASDSLIEIFYEWYGEDRRIRSMLKDVVAQVNEEVYLRVVTRVFLTGGVTVSLKNLSASGAGADVGAAPELELIDLSTEDPGAADAATNAYAKVLDTLSEKIASAEAGGAVRFAQASSRAVTLDETFKRPLVIGYRGFDVQVYKDGSLSAPIPSFATLRGKKILGKDQDDISTELLDNWIDEDEGNYDLLKTWIADQVDSGDGPSPSELIYQSAYTELRQKAVEDLLGDDE